MENIWSLQPPHQTQPPQQSVNPFNQSPPPQDDTQSQEPYPLQQNYPPLQQGLPYPQQQGSPYPQQNVYTQSVLYPPPQQGYPQQGSFSPLQQKQFSTPNSQVVGEAASFYNLGPPPVIPSGSGPGGPADRGFFDSAMQMAGAQQPPGPDDLERGWFSSSKNPLDPPPKMFKRPAPAHYAYIKFQPLSVLAVSEMLQDGFALMPPITVPGDQHPFVSHDITEEDWHKFLKDFQKTEHLPASDRLFQGMANSFMKDKTSAKIQKRTAENKLEPISDYLMAWNHYFFHPRRMSVVLAKGNRRFSGETDDYPPDVTHHTKKKKSHCSSRSVDTPLVTLAEPYPKGSLLAPLLNPIHKALYDTTVAVARAPGDLLHGITPGEKVNLSKSSKSRHYSDSESDDSTDSKEEKTPRDARRAGRNARKEERKREREKYVQAVYYGNYDAGKEKSQKSSKHSKQDSAGGPPNGRFRLVICYWDGQREVI